MEIESELVGAIVATYVIGGVAFALFIVCRLFVGLLERAAAAAWRAVRRRA